MSLLDPVQYELDKHLNEEMRYERWLEQEEDNLVSLFLDEGYTMEDVTGPEWREFIEKQWNLEESR